MPSGGEKVASSSASAEVSNPSTTRRTVIGRMSEIAAVVTSERSAAASSAR